jgi:hypothetical protein
VRSLIDCRYSQPTIGFAVSRLAFVARVGLTFSSVQHLDLVYSAHDPKAVSIRETQNEITSTYGHSISIARRKDRKVYMQRAQS